MMNITVGISQRRTIAYIKTIQARHNNKKNIHIHLLIKILIKNIIQSRGR